MLAKLRAHVRQNSIGYVALFVALGGTATAALNVTSADIVDHTVKGRDLAKGAVGSRVAANGSLKIRDLGSNSVIARLGGTTPVTTSGQGEVSAVDFPMAAGRWTQKAKETDVLFGSMQVTKTGPCNSYAQVDFYLDGQPFAFGSSPTLTSDLVGTSRTANILTSRPFIFESASPRSHTLTAKVFDECANGGEDIRVDSIKAIVVAIR